MASTSIFHPAPGCVSWSPIGVTRTYRMEFMSKRFLAAALLLSVSFAPAYAAKTSLVVGMPIEPPGLDPTVAAPVAIREVTWANLYEGLVRIDRPDPQRLARTLRALLQAEAVDVAAVAQPLRQPRRVGGQ